MVPKLDGRYIGVLLCRIIRKETSLTHILLLIVLNLRWSNSFWRRSGIYCRILLIVLCRHFVFAIKLFRVGFCLCRLPLYYRGLPQNVLNMKFLFSFSFLRWNCPLLLPSSSNPIFFSVVVSFNWFFLRAWAEVLQNIVLFRGMISVYFWCR